MALERKLNDGGNISWFPKVTSIAGHSERKKTLTGTYFKPKATKILLSLIFLCNKLRDGRVQQHEHTKLIHLPKIHLHCRLAGLECETKVVLILNLCQALTYI